MITHFCTSDRPGAVPNIFEVVPSVRLVNSDETAKVVLGDCSVQRVSQLISGARGVRSATTHAHASHRAVAQLVS
jgi:hypothetical protein